MRTARFWPMQVLGAVAGYTDGVAYLGLGRVFAANMTGNTVLLGIGLVDQVGGKRLLPGGPPRPAVALAAFTVGVLLAALALRTIRWRTWYRLALLLEAALLAAVGVAWTIGSRRSGLGTELGLLAALAAAMGVQSMLANRVGVAGVPTTVVTTSMVIALARAVGRGRPGVPAAAWAVYLGGAITGTVGIELLGTAALWPPVVVLAVLAYASTEEQEAVVGR